MVSTVSTELAIGLTAAYGAVMLYIIVVCVFLAWNGKSLFARRKSWPLFLISAVGILAILTTQVIYIWTFELSVQDSSTAIWWLAQGLYYVGFVLAFWPMTIRSWRIVCLFTRTIDVVVKPACPCIIFTLNPGIVRRKRDNLWCFRRLCIFTLPPLLAIAILQPLGQDDLAQQLWTAYDFAALAVFFLVFLALYWIRHKVTLEELVETRMLLSFSVVSCVYFIFDNIMWFEMMMPMDPTDPYRAEQMAFFELFQLVCMLLMFTATSGYCAFLMITRRELQLSDVNLTGLASPNRSYASSSSSLAKVAVGRRSVASEAESRLASETSSETVTNAV